MKEAFKEQRLASKCTAASQVNQCHCKICQTDTKIHKVVFRLEVIVPSAQLMHLLHSLHRHSKQSADLPSLVGLATEEASTYGLIRNCRASKLAAAKWHAPSFRLTQVIPGSNSKTAHAHPQPLSRCCDACYICIKQDFQASLTGS